MNGIHKAYRTEELTEYNIPHRLECTRDRRNAVADTSSVSTNANKFYPKQYYHQLAERVRELEKEVVPDRRFYQIPPAYSPCSNVGASVLSKYPRPKSFPMGLVSPNSSVPTQRYGLSPKILARAHEIPERFDEKLMNSLMHWDVLFRFWIDWQQKQMQNRIEELENIKNTLTSPNEGDLARTNRRKSLSLLHDDQQHVSRPLHKTVSTSTDDHSLISFDQRSIDNTDTPSPIEPIIPIPSIQKSQSTLDRSRLAILLPFFHTNILPQQPVSTNNHYQFFDKQLQEKTSDTKDNCVQTMSSASSIEDVAKIDTELIVTILLRDNQDQTSPLLYSKAIIHRTIEFRSLSSTKTPLV